MKNYLRILLSMLLVLAMALTIVACKPTPTPTPDGGGETPGTGDTPDTPDIPDQPDAPKEPEVVAEALATDSHDHIAALETVSKSGVNLVNRAVAVYDISLEMEGVKVQPDGKVSVSVPVLIAEILEYDVYHILSDGSVESIVSTVVDGMITFETESFSDFVFVSDEKYNIGDYNIASTSTVQVFQTMTIEKYELLFALLGIDSADDITVCFNGVEYKDILKEDGYYISTNQFYYGERITISVTPNNGYIFGSYALLDYDSTNQKSNYIYYTDTEISITLDNKWDGIMACELFAPDVDREERIFDIAVSSRKESLEDLTFTINGVEIKGENYIRNDGGSSYHINITIKNGDIITISANPPAKCRFKSFIFRAVNGDIIEEITNNSFTFKVDSNTGSLDLKLEELDYLGMQVNGYYVGWNHFNVNMHTGVHYTTVIKGTEETGPADFDVWVYTDDQEYLLTPDQYILDTDGFDINALGVYEVKYTLVEDPDMFVILCISVVVEEEMVNIDFSTIPDGEQYANEKVTVGEATVSTYNNGCYFAGQLRIYDNDTADGYAVVKAPFQISSLTFEAGHSNATLEVYVSYDGETWFHREDILVTKDYATYTVIFNPNDAYGYLKFDAVGGQIRIKNLVANRVASGSPAAFLVYAETDIDYTPMGSVAISYDGKTFSEYEDYIVQSRYGLNTTFFVLRQQAKEGYKFVGWYVYSKYPDGESHVFLLSTEDEVTTGLQTTTTVRIEARYVAE